MVRKRSRGSKKYYESEDEPETESDFEDEIISKPQPKKYSLRQRTRPTFNSDDYEYEDFDAPPAKVPSDDEEFVMQNKKSSKPREKVTKQRKVVDEDEVVDRDKDEVLDKDAVVDEDAAVTTSDPPEETADGEAAESTQEPDELVDFEDMIRADIVVNKNRIDYDNIIQKTEIKIQPLTELKATENEKKKKQLLSKSQPINKPKAKRGRKPKRKTEDLEIDEPEFLAPQIQENENDEDYHPYKPKRTRKPKARPAGEVDSSILGDYDEFDFDDQNDVDYNPDDDLYPGLSGLSNYILDKQISADMEDSLDNNQYTSVESSTSSSIVNSSDVTSNVNSSTSKLSPDTIASNNVVDTTTSKGGVTASTEEVILPEVSKESDSNKENSVSADTSSEAAVPDSTEQTENSPEHNVAIENPEDDEDEDDDDDGLPKQLNEKSGAFEKVKVTSTSSESVIQVNETLLYNSDLYLNGNMKQIENPEVNIMDCKEEIEEEDDDDEIVFIEDERKCEIIVLDD